MKETAEPAEATTMDLFTTTVPTPVGPFTLLVDDGGVCAAGFTGRPATRTL